MISPLRCLSASLNIPLYCFSISVAKSLLSCSVLSVLHLNATYLKPRLQILFFWQQCVDLYCSNIFSPCVLTGTCFFFLAFMLCAFKLVTFYIALHNRAFIISIVHCKQNKKTREQMVRNTKLFSIWIWPLEGSRDDLPPCALSMVLKNLNAVIFTFHSAE